MSSRDVVIERIRSALATSSGVAVPAIPEVWPRTHPEPDQLVERFQRELEAVHGECVRCATMAEAKQKVAGWLAQEGWETLGAVDRPLCRQVLADLGPERVRWASSDWTPQAMAALPVGMVEADCLLADTGTVMVACPRPEQRLMCYLPPTCVVVGTADRLAEHLPAAWDQIAPQAADPKLRGEFVFITGPSRTADIEKILILGVHGPKRLIVLLIG